MTTPILWQSWGRGGAGMPHDSTIGVGPGFYWFGLAVLVFIALGVGKVWLEQSHWKGRVLKYDDRRKKFIDDRNKEEKRKDQRTMAMRINNMEPEARKALQRHVKSRR